MCAAMRALVPAVLFVTIAVLVDLGAPTGVDQYAVSHWMPWLRPAHHALIVPSRLFLPPLRGAPLGSVLLDLWTYPASLFVSAVVVLVCTIVTRRLVFAALWIAVNAVELVGKLVVERPPLYAHGHVHVTGFDHSLPSGHTMRAFVLATALAWTVRRGRLAYVWAATVPVALVVAGDHVPTDVVAGTAAFLALIAAAVRPP
jgi:membrane-associated phospholipid phosphatase